jgi:hypothetical protein
MLVEAIDPDSLSVRYLDGVAAISVPFVAESISRSLSGRKDALSPTSIVFGAICTLLHRLDVIGLGVRIMLGHLLE